MAIAQSQQVLSVPFIPIEGIYPCAPECVHCSGQLAEDCRSEEWLPPLHYKIQRPGPVVEVIGRDGPVCPQEEPKDLLGVRGANGASF